MVLGQDPEIDKLLEGLKRMFQQNTTPTPATAPVGNVSWTSPIHGTWYNAGGYNVKAHRWYDSPGKSSGHKGVDMSVSGGTPVYSFGPGTVVRVGTDPIGGNVVWVEHPGKVFTYYAHLSTAKVQIGDKVNQNTVLGTVGKTGNASKGFPHVHFEVHLNDMSRDSAVDPARYMTVPPYNPDYGRNPLKYQKEWVSNEAKQEAASFNMKAHLSQKNRLASTMADTLLKIAGEYYKLVSGQSKRQ